LVRVFSSPGRHPEALALATRHEEASLDDLPGQGSVPIGGGAALVPIVANHLVIQTIPYRPADHPNRSRHREAPEGDFSGRSPVRRRASRLRRDPPKPWRRRGRGAPDLPRPTHAGLTPDGPSG